MREAIASGVGRGVAQGLQNQLDPSSGSGSTGGSSGISAGGSLNQERTEPYRVTRETKQFGLSLAASYEVDLWGRIYTAYRAADYDYDATREDLESVAMTLAAEVADRWLRIIEQEELRRLLSEQLETNKTYLELVELRFRKGQEGVSALDVYQQRQAVGEVAKQVPLVEAQEQLLRYDLAVLLGKPPASELATGEYELTTVPPLPSTGVPAELLARRPDIRAGLSRLNAADYRVASARADRLPAIRLTGGIGYSTDDIDHFFDDWFVNLASGLTMPLFDGFRREAEVERTLAVVEERLADYRLTVLTAIREVEDALIQERKQREYIEALTQQVDDASRALREATERYQKGLNDYLPVLTALERTQALTRNLISARRELLIYRVNLYRALGGSWTQELEAPVRLSDEVAMAKEGES
jgi:NodT family efflux transporter outer membrane factor (OMF) lipoprotein